MGLFSKLRGKPAKAAPEDGLACAMLVAPLLVAFADGECSMAETQAIIDESCKIDVFARLGLQRTTDLVKQTILDLKAKGGEPVLKDVIPLMSVAQRETSMIFAARVAAADGTVEHRETGTLAVIATHMGLSNARCGELAAIAYNRRAA